MYMNILCVYKCIFNIYTSTHAYVCTHYTRCCDTHAYTVKFSHTFFTHTMMDLFTHPCTRLFIHENAYTCMEACIDTYTFPYTQTTQKHLRHKSNLAGTCPCGLHVPSVCSSCREIPPSSSSQESSGTKTIEAFTACRCKCLNNSKSSSENHSACVTK